MHNITAQNKTPTYPIQIKFYWNVMLASTC